MLRPWYLCAGNLPGRRYPNPRKLLVVSTRPLALSYTRFSQRWSPLWFFEDGNGTICAILKHILVQHHFSLPEARSSILTADFVGGQWVAIIRVLHNSSGTTDCTTFRQGSWLRYRLTEDTQSSCIINGSGKSSPQGNHCSCAQQPFGLIWRILLSLVRGREPTVLCAV